MPDYRPALPALVLASALALLATGCSDADGGDTGDSGDGGSTRTEDAPALVVERFASPNPGSVNTYWFETADGLVAIDAQRSLTDAGSAVESIRAAGEPVTALLLTHPHPDHVGGVGVFHDAWPEAAIHASEATRDFMRDDPLGFYELTRQLPDSDYAEELFLPDRLIEDGATLDLGGVRLETAEFGPGESVTTTVFHEPESGSLFVGDLVNNEAIPALLEGNTCGWLTHLEELRELFPDARTIYPGHGAPGDAAELIGAQRDYLLHVRSLVRPAVAADSPGGAELTDDELASAVDRLAGEHPAWPPVATLPDLHSVNVEAVATELAAEDPAALPAACRDSA